jgi:hypothetical protein
MAEDAGVGGPSPNPRTIWQLAQNRPTLIARDLGRWGVPIDETYRILLSRGVFKWFAVRRELIKLKNAWKEAVAIALSQIAEYKRLGDVKKRAYWVGYLHAMEECRAGVRALCHSPRWRAPDNDRHAVRWLEGQGGNRAE